MFYRSDDANTYAFREKPGRCSSAAREAGEELAGTAPTFDIALVLEIPPPWPQTMSAPMWEASGMPSELREAIADGVEFAVGKGLTVRVLGVLFDPQYSTTGKRRLMCFSRQKKSDALMFSSDEALVDDSDAPYTAYAMLTDQRKHPKPASTRNLLVCTHAAVDACCGRLGYPLYKRLRSLVDESSGIRVWRCSAIGGHRFAPTLIDFPDGRYWGNLEESDLRNLLQADGPLGSLSKRYRGWSSLNDGALQSVEKTLFEYYGWRWRSLRSTIHKSHPDIVSVVVHDVDTSNAHKHVFKVTPREGKNVQFGCSGMAGVVVHYDVKEL